MATATEHRPIAAIEADLSQAAQQVLATAKALNEAQQRRDELTRELHGARVAADVDLPRATIMRRGKVSQYVVVSRRTASTIFTRAPGGEPQSERAWRESKYIPGQWNEHPKRHGAWLDAETLQLRDEQ